MFSPPNLNAFLRLIVQNPDFLIKFSHVLSQGFYIALIHYLPIQLTLFPPTANARASTTPPQPRTYKLSNYFMLKFSFAPSCVPMDQEHLLLASLEHSIQIDALIRHIWTAEGGTDFFFFIVLYTVLRVKVQ